jgi:murein DD-endopeptidase MepM/ murein hydrolase activator NlpD
MVLSLILSGCATAPYQAPSAGIIPGRAGGIYHEVNSGDTLWRIAKTYGIEMSSIVRANGLSDASKINPGQRLFIPGADTPLKVAAGAAAGFDRDYFTWPIEGEVVSYYGQKSGSARNKGIDIAARPGSNVRASKSGRVAFCNENFKGHGNIIIIDHLDDFFTVYSRNAQNLVKPGDLVQQNQTIALAGSGGREKETGLHFEVRKRGRPQNPLYYLP